MNKIYVFGSNLAGRHGKGAALYCRKYMGPIGCGLAGYKYEDIAPFFKDAPENVILPKEFRDVLNG